MVKTLFVDASWEGEIRLSEEVLSFLREKKIQKAGLFASVQFLKLDIVKKQLEEEGILVLTTKAKRTDLPMQILGCDIYSDSYTNDIFSDADLLVYVGDGLFHPKALLFSQLEKKEGKDVLLWNPLSEKMSFLKSKDVLLEVKKRFSHLKKFILARKIGILITIKPGQQYFDLSLKLKNKLKKEGKECFIFLDNTFDYTHFENYPFVDVWVNSACPRIGSDDLLHIRQPLINIRDAFDAEKSLKELKRIL